MASSESVDAGKGPPRVGSYRLIKPLGTGGMSSVFHAVHAETGHEVAVKVLPRVLAKNPTLLQRFLREAVNAESLEHPNIAAIYDRGFDGGRHYLVLEYVDGGDLHERVRAAGPLPIGETARLIRSVAEGLDYALGRGVIHRDIKPANLLVTPEGRVKIIDLGLALQTTEEDERVTRDGTTVGTVDYMAPEQARDSRATSVRSDIYSLGCTFYFLLTGQPPYPGGDIPDKLGRHVAASVPDVRALRPDVSAPLAELIQKMMAKKPDHRFSGYAPLIAAIDELPESVGRPLEALIADDEDEDEEDGVITLTVATPAPAPAKPATLPEPKRPRPAERKKEAPPAERKKEAPPAEISLADLAALDEDEPRPVRSRSRATPAATPGVSVPLAGEEDDAYQPPRAAVRASKREVPLSTWIAAGAVLGLAIALLGYGVLQVLGTGDTSAAGVPTPDERGPEPRGEEMLEPAAPTQRVPRTGPRSIATKAPAAPAAVAWKEPADPVLRPPAEAAYPPEVEAAFLADWARSPIPTAIEGPSVVLQRIADPGRDDDAITLRQALDKNGGLVEIADNGPFFADDFRIAGKARLIRARAGFRPMIRVEPPQLTVVRERPAVIPLDGGKLVLQGLDLVVDARALPPTQTALFLLRGGELTIDRCTVTILNAAGRAFSLVRLEDPGDERAVRTSRVRIQNSLIRGASPAVFDLHGAGDVAVVRSLILAPGESIAVERPSTSRGERRFLFYRSILATRGAVLELPGGRAQIAQVRALGSTFAKVAGLDPSGLVRARTTLAGPPAGSLDWDGRDNAFVGWPSWLSSADRGTALVPGLASAREVWRGSDPESREQKRGWVGAAIDDLGPPAALQGFADATPAILERVAVPEPILLDATVGSIERLRMPQVKKRAATGPAPLGSFVPPPTMKTAISRRDFDSARKGGRPPSGPGSAPGAPSASAAVTPYEDATFDAADPAWRGDLGAFLGSKLRPGLEALRVRARGGGTWPMSPIRFPAGLLVEIEVEGTNLAWYPAQGASAPALFDCAGGDLALTGVTLLWNSSARVARLIEVEDGHLLLSRCVLRSADSTLPTGAGLVLFRAPGTRPLPAREGPFLSPTDRPTFYAADCIFMTIGGEAIGAELGRGVVNLVNTAILSEGDGTAIGVRPQHVARDRFEADLALDRCSIAAERTHVRLGPWPGSDPGPARPWLVSTNRCAFFEVAARSRRDSVLLRTTGTALSHGALSWQANGDAYDLIHFTVVGPTTPANLRFPNVRQQWVDFWGARHVVNVLGPTLKSTESAEPILTKERLRPGGLRAEDLKLDAKEHPDLGVELGLLPVASAR